MKCVIKQCGLLILAAGSSSRMGKPKQLLEFEGATLLTHVAKVACQSNVYPIILVLGANEDVIRKSLDIPQLDIVTNENWETGMASSIIKGICYIKEKYPKVDGIMIIVGDQPYLDETQIYQLINLQNTSGLPIAACSYAGIIGTPALFHKSVFSELLGLNGDIGAKKIIEKRMPNVVTIPFDKGVIDIDTEEDYMNLIKK
jgi:molybdenum cofactor cytidylyltransferase